MTAWYQFGACASCGLSRYRIVSSGTYTRTPFVCGLCESCASCSSRFSKRNPPSDVVNGVCRSCEVAP